MAVVGELNADVDVVEYLKTPPDREALERIVDLLDDPVADLVRKDARFRQLGLDPADYTAGPAVVDLLLAQPRLMQRPLLVSPTRAIVGRPTARVREFLAAP